MNQIETRFSIAMEIAFSPFLWKPNIIIYNP